MGFKRGTWAALTLVAGIVVSLSGCGGGSSTFNDAPIITALNPSNVTAGSQSFTLFITGSSFINDSRGASFAYWNNSPRSTTLNASTGQLQVTIPASDVVAPGLVQITITTPPPGGGTASALFFTVEAPQAGGPVVTTLSPSSIASGGNNFTLTVNGQNFSANDVVSWNSSWRTTTFVNSTQLTAQITNTDIGTAITGNISVINSADALVASPIVDFPVTGADNGVPAIKSLSPSTAAANTVGLEVFVNGSNFVPTSSAQWNGTPIPTSYVSASQVIVLIPSSDLIATGTANITVVNPAPGGGTSGNSTFTVTTSSSELRFLGAPIFAGFFGFRL